mmetsp:Transcript_16901/g.41555  ORF Transcript_16901/g.41555 Transcript_16901/m.41555 type:complete len:285 (-) Transcript_16901:456-1310(-)
MGISISLQHRLTNHYVVIHQRVLHAPSLRFPFGAFFSRVSRTFSSCLQALRTNPNRWCRRTSDRRQRRATRDASGSAPVALDSLTSPQVLSSSPAQVFSARSAGPSESRRVSVQIPPYIRQQFFRPLAPPQIEFGLDSSILPSGTRQTFRARRLRLLLPSPLSLLVPSPRRMHRRSCNPNACPLGRRISVFSVFPPSLPSTRARKRVSAFEPFEYLASPGFDLESAAFHSGFLKGLHPHRPSPRRSLSLLATALSPYRVSPGGQPPKRSPRRGWLSFPAPAPPL